MKYYTILYIYFCNPSFSQNIEIGSVAPKIISYQILKTSQDFNSNDLKVKDKIIVLEFWASWCKPCLESISHTNKLIDSLKNKENYIFISMTNESPIIINKIINKLDFKTIVCTDTTNSTQKKYGDKKKGILELPYAYVIRNDTIKWKGNVYNLNSDILLIENSENNNLQKYILGNDTFNGKNKDVFDFNYFIDKLSKSETNIFHIRNSYKFDYNYRRLKYNNLYVKSLDLLNIYNKIFGINKNLIEVDIRLTNLYFDIINLSDDSENSLIELESKILSYANSVKSKKIKTIKSYELNFDLKNISKSSIKLKSKRNLDGTYYLFGFSILDLIDFLNANSDLYFYSNINLDERYDFVIDSKDIINSLIMQNVTLKEVFINKEITVINPH